MTVAKEARMRATSVDCSSMKDRITSLSSVAKNSSHPIAPGFALDTVESIFRPRIAMGRLPMYDSGTLWSPGKRLRCCEFGVINTTRCLLVIEREYIILWPRPHFECDTEHESHEIESQLQR